MPDATRRPMILNLSQPIRSGGDEVVAETRAAAEVAHLDVDTPPHRRFRRVRSATDAPYLELDRRAFLVGDALKAAMEDFDLGALRFREVEILDHDDSALSAQYWRLGAIVERETLDLTQSRDLSPESGHGFENADLLEEMGDGARRYRHRDVNIPACCVRGDCRGGPDFWREARVWDIILFCSHRLGVAVRAFGLGFSDGSVERAA